MIQQIEITLKPKSRGFHLVTSVRKLSRLLFSQASVVVVVLNYKCSFQKLVVLKRSS